MPRSDKGKRHKYPKKRRVRSDKGGKHDYPRRRKKKR